MRQIPNTALLNKNQVSHLPGRPMCLASDKQGWETNFFWIIIFWWLQEQTTRKSNCFYKAQRKVALNAHKLGASVTGESWQSSLCFCVDNRTMWKSIVFPIMVYFQAAGSISLLRTSLNIVFKTGHHKSLVNIPFPPLDSALHPHAQWLT